MIEGLGKLSEKQRNILYLQISGKQVKEIAYALGVTEQAIQYHCRRMKKLYKVKTTLEVVTTVLISCIEPKVLQELNMKLVEEMKR